MKGVYDQPMAAQPYKSYRYPSAYGGWIMIGARDDEDALAQASRSLSAGVVSRDKLERWTGPEKGRAF